MLLLRDSREPAQPFCSDRRALDRIGELCPDGPQIARTDGFTSQHTDRLLAGYVCVHQDESQCARRFVLRYRDCCHFSLWAVRGSWGESPLRALGSWFRAVVRLNPPR